VVAANPDEAVAAIDLPPAAELEKMLYASLDREKTREALGLPSYEEMGSNAYGVGSDASQTDSGILFGNPHFPWQGNRRLFMFHQSLGEEFDVMGAALIGAPAPLIGFNQNVAWSHTVSTAQRFTFYELTLNPENKLQYLYDGEYRDFETRTVTAQRMTSRGLETVEHTFYLSHFGPIVDLGAISPLGAGWPNAFGTLVAYRDVNLENIRLLEQFVRMAQAGDLTEFKQALGAMSLPWVNTVAADRYGDAFYGDISVTPHVSVAQVKNCVRGVAQNFLTDSGVLTMDGSDSACEWGSDSGVPQGIFNYDSMPKLETREYAANANDSYWLPNPRNLTTGYSRVIGLEGIEQSIRTRHTFSQAERRLAGQDEYGEAGFNINNIRQLHYQATNHAAELTLKAVVDICNEVLDWSVYSNDAAAAELACDVLGSWDGRHQLESVGAHVFYELWRLIYNREGLWSVPFSPAQPVGTPTSVSLDSENVEAIRQALADAAAKLTSAGIALDAPWGEIHYATKNGTKLGMHGGNGAMMFSDLQSELIEGEGYEVQYGNSYIQAVTWDESDCPDAYAILTYSQSTDPASDHYADATKLYSEGGWIDMPFCEADRDAQEIHRATISE
jgi:acyl-homoserine-lactone acylase